VDLEDGGLLFTVRSGSWRPLAPGSWHLLLRTEMRNEDSMPWNNASYRYDSLSASGRAADVDCFGPEPEVEVEPQDVGDAIVGFRVACEPTGHLRLRLHADDDHEDILDVTPPTAAAEC
jgi:hypothetical protein